MCVARRLNSPLDSLVEIFDLAGRRLAMNDDFEDKAAGLLTHHADSRVEVTLPEAGRYFVRIADTQRHGGPEYGYRLRLGPREPDFALRIVPSTINVRAGGTVTLTAYAVRRDGFAGAQVTQSHRNMVVFVDTQDTGTRSIAGAQASATGLIVGHNSLLCKNACKPRAFLIW